MFLHLLYTPDKIQRLQIVSIFIIFTSFGCSTGESIHEDADNIKTEIWGMEFLEQVVNAVHYLSYVIKPFSGIQGYFTFWGKKRGVPVVEQKDNQWFWGKAVELRVKNWVIL